MDGILQHDKQQGRRMGWHGKTDVKPDLCIENSWLNDWDYVSRQVEYTTEEGKKVKLPFQILGVTDVPELTVGQSFNPETFRPVYNKSLLAKIAKAIEGQGLTLESCGTVLDRGRLFLSFGLESAQFKAAGRNFSAYLNIGNGNDKSSKFWMNTSNLCTECQNCFVLNMESAGQIMEIKKTKNSDLEINQVGKAIKEMLKEQREFARCMNILHKIESDEATAREFFAGFISGNPDEALSTRSQGTVETLVNLFKQGAGNDGNDWSDIFSAISDWYTHSSASEQDDEKSRWKNFVSSEFGSGKVKKMEAWAIINDEKQRKAYIKLGKHTLHLTAKMLREEAKAEKEIEAKAKTPKAKENAPETPTDATNATPETEKQPEVPATV